MKTPALVCSEAFSVFLHKHCPVVAETFSPTPWCWGGRLQTLVCALIKSRPPVTYRNELIRTVDGGQISLDWVDNQASTAYPESSTRPTVLILPGLTGNSQQTYVLHAITQASRHGYRCVVFNNRGFGGEELLVSTMKWNFLFPLFISTYWSRYTSLNLFVCCRLKFGLVCECVWFIVVMLS